MKKNKQILIAIALAVVFALCAAYGVYRILEPQRTTIYVFNDDYTTGTQVTADMLTPVQADASVIVAGGTADASSQFITSAEYRDMLQSGNSLRIDVAKGMPLMTSMLSLIGGNRIEMTMQSTAIAVTVSVDGVTGITNDLGPGARVNIYVTYGASGTTLLLENMRVLAVNKTTTNDIISATIEVDNSEAIKLIEAANRGTIYLGLVNGNGYQSVLEPIRTMSRMQKRRMRIWRTCRPAIRLCLRMNPRPRPVRARNQSCCGRHGRACNKPRTRSS